LSCVGGSANRHGHRLRRTQEHVLAIEPTHGPPAQRGLPRRVRRRTSRSRRRSRAARAPRRRSRTAPDPRRRPRRLPCGHARPEPRTRHIRRTWMPEMLLRLARTVDDLAAGLLVPAASDLAALRSSQPPVEQAPREVSIPPVRATAIHHPLTAYQPARAPVAPLTGLRTRLLVLIAASHGELTVPASPLVAGSSRVVDRVARCRLGARRSSAARRLGRAGSVLRRIRR
jgi:hypothetical protein